MKKMLDQKIQVLKPTLEKPTQNNKFNEKLYNEMLCMCVCKINKKMIRFSTSFRFSLLIPLRQPKGFLLKHKHTVYFWVPFFCFLA